MDNEVVKKDLSSVLGVNELPPEEQELFLAEVGNVVLQTALVRFVSTLDDRQNEALNHFLETVASPEDLFQHLSENYKDFSDYLDEAVIEFKENALEVMGEERGKK